MCTQMNKTWMEKLFIGPPQLIVGSRTIKRMIDWVYSLKIHKILKLPK